MHLFGKAPSAESDEVLMGLLMKRDKAAFEELYARYSGKMYYYFYRMLGRDREKAQDFTQDLFLKIITAPGSFDPAKRFSPWFYTLATNMCKNEFKRVSRKPLPLDEEQGSQCTVPDDGCDDLDLAAFSEELYLHLDELNEEQKTVFLLRHGSGLSLKEIAEMLNSPEGTIKSRLFYAIKYLSSKLMIYNPGVN